MAKCVLDKQQDVYSPSSKFCIRELVFKNKNKNNPPKTQCGFLKLNTVKLLIQQSRISLLNEVSQLYIVCI